MKHIYVFLSVAVLACGALLADSPRFITRAMYSRNGLTDEQYEMLWAIGKRPSIDVATARDWMFRAARYHNVTNWLGLIGRTNDFARAIITITDRADALAATNIALSAVNTKLANTMNAMEKALQQYRAENTNLVARLSAAQESLADAQSNAAQITERLNAAEARAARLDALKSWLEECRDKSLLDTTKKIYQAIINKLEDE